MRTKFLLLTAAFGLTSALALGQVSIDTENFNYFDAFTGFQGTADPTNWETSDAGGNDSSVWQGTGTGSGTAGGKWSYGDTGTGATFDGSLGFLPSGNRAINADIIFENNTGFEIISFEISYLAEHWRSANGGRLNGWAVSYNIDGGSYTALNDLTYVASNTNATGINPSGGTWESMFLSQSITGLSIPDGSTIGIRFFGDNGSSTGSRQGVAIDDFSFSATAIPEPGTLALVGLFGLTVYAFRKRK
ncbi:MAG: PEP-CTERM sorting domain-containing protein [Verrucomicrobia bacterium]|nr:PEP-CTERM sorting domain-containing protein [Verrucomicrobiota bacterium]MCH8513705.1 PEP-CTERM sorting domain-containing protein [Kiritimatiellia bacterium]